MFCMLGGIFALRWLSYSVAGRGVVNPTMIRVTLLCGRVLRGRALWRLLRDAKLVPCPDNPCCLKQEVEVQPELRGLGPDKKTLNS